MKPSSKSFDLWRKCNNRIALNIDNTNNNDDINSVEIIPEIPKEKVRLKKIFNNIVITPGPGSYNICKDTTSKKIKESYRSISFDYHNTLDSKRGDTIIYPGPGAYDIYDFESSPGISFNGGIRDFSQKELNRWRCLNRNKPTYPKFMGSISYIGKSPGIKISPLSMYKENIHTIEKPKDYNIPELEKGPEYSMSGKKLISIENYDSPGPGTYEIRSAFGYYPFEIRPPDGPIKTVEKSKESLGTPGPGSYYPNNLFNIPSVK